MGFCMGRLGSRPWRTAWTLGMRASGLPWVRDSTCMLGIEVCCAKGKYRVGFDFSSTRLYLLSPMTPTMVNLFSGLFFPTEWPSASPLGKKRFEKVSLTRTTLGADRV